jgi:hypothetical protein
VKLDKALSLRFVDSLSRTGLLKLPIAPNEPLSSLGFVYGLSKLGPL